MFELALSLEGMPHFAEPQASAIPDQSSHNTELIHFASDTRSVMSHFPPSTSETAVSVPTGIKTENDGDSFRSGNIQTFVESQPLGVSANTTSSTEKFDKACTPLSMEVTTSRLPSPVTPRRSERIRATQRTQRWDFDVKDSRPSIRSIKSHRAVKSSQNAASSIPPNSYRSRSASLELVSSSQNDPRYASTTAVPYVRRASLRTAQAPIKKPSKARPVTKMKASAIQPLKEFEARTKSILRADDFSPSPANHGLSQVSVEVSSLGKDLQQISGAVASTAKNAVFHYLLSDESLGAVQKSLAQSCDVTSFFSSAFEAWSLLKKGCKQTTMSGVSVNFESCVRPIVVLWRDAQGFETMLEKVALAANAKGGILDVEIRCIK